MTTVVLKTTVQIPEDGLTPPDDLKRTLEAALKACLDIEFFEVTVTRIYEGKADA